MIARHVRRILLIDADVEFQELLTNQLRRYGLEIVVNVDGADALSQIGPTKPVLVIIAVEEPDKQGYALFNRAKKGAASGLPIILVTRTLAPKSFADHRRLKLHADEYIDKSTVSSAELLGKIDNLINLGDIGTDSVPLVSIEVDDAPVELSDGDLVLEETFGEDEPVLHQTTPPPPMSGAGIHVVPRGDDFERDEAATITGDPIDPNLAAETDAAFDALLGGGGDTVPPPTTKRSKPITAIPPLPARAKAVTGPQPQMLGATPEPIPDPREEVRLPILLEPEGTQKPPVDDAVVAPIPTERGLAAIPEPVPEPIPVPVGIPDEPEAPPAPMVSSSGIDLGLDAVAETAERDQSGVHDRRTLQRLHMLERDNARLKSELDRAKQDGAARPGGASREFLNLREMISSRDKEIAELREESGDKDRQLMEARERLRQLQHAKTAIEGKNLELEQRILGDADRAEAAEIAQRTAEQNLRAAEAQLAEARARVADVEDAAKAEVDRMTTVAGRAERARLDAEQHMATERTNAEAALAAERASHQQALSALRAEHEQALATAREEHERAVTAARAEARAAADADAERARGELEAKHAATLAARDDEHNARAEGFRAGHALEIEELRAAHARELETARADAARSLADAETRAQAVIDEARKALADAVASADARIASTTAELTAQKDQAIAAAAERAAAEIEAARVAHQQEMNEQQQRHTQAMDELRIAHARSLSEKDAAAARADEEHRKALVQASASHAEAMTQLRTDNTRAIEEAERRIEQLRQADRADLERAAAAARAEHEAKLTEARDEAAQLEKGLASSREHVKRLEADVVAAGWKVKAKDEEIAQRDAAIAERDKRIADLRSEIESLETDNATYQEQVLKAYQRIKADEAKVARTQKALAIALTALDEERDKTPD
jgi:CheY-like chemotaxis protein